ncbi:Mur ligase [Aspergillus japonicus CBS 114.51]|uniref:tetrahydrofolate synthase n=1 Tax=Aspergillus japonicus CBS 114.51 TaxID=1448312 RepID=A0A8T8XG70_ASPJA|nr:Mur ligase [Aspergillus japonicus CBS 114.51]RAH86292.1 Mur ligase [Aspergillus japonicus CBS 114.51]
MAEPAPNYIEAIQKLNSTQTGFKNLRKRRPRWSSSSNSTVLDRMRTWIECLGYSISDLDRLNIVHVAGTKGKGTTCAYVDSILQQYRMSYGTPCKVGLFTSPHLTTVRERIRINSEPLSEAKFAKYFLEVWNALELTAAKAPSYARLLTLMSFHVFMQEEVDTAIYEVGVGGQWDSTNVFANPAATGISSLGIDHVNALGSTIDQIAWHKAGIFKKAIERGTHLNIVEVPSAIRGLDIKPAEHFQRQNASLAVRLTETVLTRLGIAAADDCCESDRLPALFDQGLENLDWKGRCRTLVTGQHHWYLDGAHTHESLEVACSWFGRVSGTQNLPRVLIFNQQHSSRDPVALLRTVHRIIYDNLGVVFQYAIFRVNSTYKDQSCNPELVNHNRKLATA